MNIIICKLCNSDNVKKYGFIDGKQMYYCNDCKRKFKDDDSLFGYRISSKDVSSARAKDYPTIVSSIRVKRIDY